MLASLGGPAPQQQPQQPPQQVSGQLPPEVASGQRTDLEVGPSGGEGLWNIAHDIHKGLDENMRKTNSAEQIFEKLRTNAIDKHGFAKGTDNGKLPTSYQGDQTSGRDLDLIYAKDKFQIDLNKPEGGAPPAAPPSDGPDAQKLGLDPKHNGAWNDFRTRNPQFDAQFKGMPENVQRAFVGSFNQAAAKDPKEVGALGDFIKTDGFKALDGGQQEKALQLAGKHGAAAASELVNDAGFKTLKGTKAPSLNDDENRNSQTVVLDKALQDENYLKALQNGMRGEGGFTKVDDPNQRGQAMVFMAMYTGRKNGYQQVDNKGTDNEKKSEILERLWNNVLSPKYFMTGGGNYIAQNLQINSWVDKRGFQSDDMRPD